MERRITPGCQVDPRVAPAGQPRPVPEAIRRPRGVDGREPDGAVVGERLPCPVRAEVGLADHLPRHVGVLARRLVHAIARRAPGVEAVEAATVADVNLLGRDAGQRGDLPRPHGLDAGRRCDLRFAFANDHRRQRAVGRDVDPVETRPLKRDLRRRRIDAHRVVGLEHAHADDDATCGDEQRELPIVESRHVQIRVAGKPELPTAVVDFGDAVAIDVEIVALRDGVVEPDLRPVARTLVGRVAQHSLHVRDASHASRKVIVGACGDRDENARAADERNQRAADRSPKRAVAGLAAASVQYRSFRHDSRTSGRAPTLTGAAVVIRWIRICGSLHRFAILHPIPQGDVRHATHSIVDGRNGRGACACRGQCFGAIHEHFLFRRQPDRCRFVQAGACRPAPGCSRRIRVPFGRRCWRSATG